MPYSNNLGNSSVSPSLITNRFKEPALKTKDDAKSEKSEFAKTLDKVNKSKDIKIPEKINHKLNHIDSNSNDKLNKSEEILKSSQNEIGTNFALNKTSSKISDRPNKEDELVKLSQEFEKTIFKSLWNSAFNANEINDPEFEGGFGEQLMKTELVNAWVEASYKPEALQKQIYNQLKTSSETKDKSKL